MKKQKEEFFIQNKYKRFFTNSKVQFNKKLDYYLKSNYQNKKLSLNEKKVLNYYLGNTDGNSGSKVRNFLYKLINWIHLLTIF